MTKKIAVIGGAGQIAAAVAHAMMRAPGSVVVVDTQNDFVTPDGKLVVLDEATMTIGYDPEVIKSLESKMSDEELYGISLHEAHRMIFEGRVGDYKLPAKDMKIVASDDLPKNAKKPKFLLAENHRITKVRR